MAGQLLSPAALERWLPPFNTALIVVSGVFLILGYAFIRRKEIARHRAAMLTATVFAAGAFPKKASLGGQKVDPLTDARFDSTP